MLAKLGVDVPPPARSIRLSFLNTVRRGCRFEALAEALLKKRGWRVLDRNVRFLRKEIDLVVEVDPDLIGGAIANVGGVVFDGSLRTQLSQLRDSLTKG